MPTGENGPKTSKCLTCATVLARANGGRAERMELGRRRRGAARKDLTQPQQRAKPGAACGPGWRQSKTETGLWARCWRTETKVGHGACWQRFRAGEHKAVGAGSHRGEAKGHREDRKDRRPEDDEPIQAQGGDTSAPIDSIKRSPNPHPHPRPHPHPSP